MMALVLPPDFLGGSGSSGTTWEAEIFSPGGITGVGGVSLSDVANPASAEGSTDGDGA